MAEVDDWLAGMTDADDGDAWQRDAAIRELDWGRELPADEGGAAARAASALLLAVGPLNSLAIRIYARPPAPDPAWNAATFAFTAVLRRRVSALRFAGLEQRLVERDLQIIDRVRALTGSASGQAWNDAVHAQLRQLADASRRGREHGRRLRAQGAFRPAPSTEQRIGWMLRHPGGHWLARLRPLIDDPSLASLIDDWMTELDASYIALVHAVARELTPAADVVVDVEMPADLPPGGWDRPLATIVRETHSGTIGAGARLDLRQVPPGDAPFDGTLMAALPGERWRLRASVLADTSALPADGTHRLAA